MTESKRQELISRITKYEALRPLSRMERLSRDPLHALPYYVLAALAHIKPFKLTFSTLWDTSMTCYLPEGNTFYYYGYCEANLTNFLLRYLQDGMTVIDVGAHVGMYTMLSAELVGSTGIVHGFEPTPWTFNLLTKNTKTLPQVTIHQNAVAETSRQLQFADYGPGYGAYNSAHAAGAPAMKKTPASVTITSIALDTFCTEHALQPDLIKIDSEGFEYEVLQGAAGLLNSTGTLRPLITIEVANGDAWGENRNQAFSFLSERGYQAFALTTDGRTERHEQQTSYDYDNLLFVPSERLSELQSFTL